MHNKMIDSVTIWLIEFFEMQKLEFVENYYIEIIIFILHGTQ